LKDFTQKSLESHYEQKQNEGSIAENSAIPYEEIISQREKQIISKLGLYVSDVSQLEAEESHFGLPIFWELMQDKAP